MINPSRIDPFSGGGPRGRPGHWQPVKLTLPIRKKIIDQFAVARQSNPELSVYEFARREALQFNLTAANIRRVLYHYSNEAEGDI